MADIALTPARRRELLQALFWSERGFADIIGIDPRTVRRWIAGQREVPADIDAWLELAGAWMLANPPPTRNRSDAREAGLDDNRTVR